MEKAEFRQICKDILTRRARIAKAYRDHRASKRLEALLAMLRANKILFYVPFGFEVDIEPLMRRLKGRKKVFIPLMEDTSFRMVEYRLPLRRGNFGIREATGRIYRYTRIDAAVVPVLGIDGGWARIGFGKGMYDRFFSLLGYRPVIIFIQLTVCHTKELLGKSHDLIGDWMVTPDLLMVRGIRLHDRIDIDRIGGGCCRIFGSKKARRSQIRYLC
ncbi:MAG: 5-formyltetrahydrofolate cyclo-ligase [Campylobacterales bacterium]